MKIIKVIHFSKAIFVLKTEDTVITETSKSVNHLRSTKIGSSLRSKANPLPKPWQSLLWLNAFWRGVQVKVNKKPFLQQLNERGCRSVLAAFSH